MTPALKRARKRIAVLTELVAFYQRMPPVGSVADEDQWHRRFVQAEEECAMLSFDLSKALVKIKQLKRASRLAAKRPPKLKRRHK